MSYTFLHSVRKLFSWDNKTFRLLSRQKNVRDHNQILLRVTKVLLKNQNLIGTANNFFLLDSNQTFCCSNQTVFLLYCTVADVKRNS